MAEQLERIANLLALLLQTTRPLTLEQISDELAGQYSAEATTRRAQFERDKRVLRDEGIPIETTVLVGEHAGATGYRVDRARFELADLALTDEEKRALQLAAATVRLDPTAAGRALTKLATDDTDPGPLLAALPQAAALAPLCAANAAHHEVGFTYRGKERRLQPWGVVMRQGFWYVVGHDVGAGEQRVYRVDRIESAVDVDAGHTFEVPDGFDAMAAVTVDPKVLGEGEPAEALVLIDAVLAGKVRREVGDGAVVEARPGGAVVVRVPCTNRAAFRSWVIGLLDHAEVLAPDEVRADLVGWLEAVAAP
jgi:predicted DNA-binding transcriptional regulator YafY